MNTILSNNPLTRFSKGFFYPFRGGKFLGRHPRLWKYVLVPFLINLLVFSLAVYFGLDFFNQTVVGMVPSGEAWYWVALYYLAWVIAVLLTMVLVFFSFTVVGNLISSPFNDLLSERTEEEVMGSAHGESFRWSAVGRILLDESKKMAIFVLLMVLLLLLNLIPGFGTLAYSILSFLLTVFFLVIEYTGYVFGRKGGRFRDQRRFIRGRRFMAFGFGVGVLCLLAIPLLQFFCIPFAVVGATLLWCDAQPDSDAG
jgi:CysZ protein